MVTNKRAAPMGERKKAFKKELERRLRRGDFVKITRVGFLSASVQLADGKLLLIKNPY